MGTHGRPVMGSHRPGPMGPSIVPSPPPGWPDVARSQDFEMQRCLSADEVAVSRRQQSALQD